MLRKVQNLIVILGLFFSSINFAYAQMEENPQKEIDSFVSKLKDLQKLLEAEMSKDKPDNTEVITKGKPVIVDEEGQNKNSAPTISKKEDANYYYYILTFAELRKDVDIKVQNNVVKFLSINKATSQNKDRRNPVFKYDFRIPNSRYSRFAELVREGNNVTVKVPKVESLISKRRR